MGLQSPGREVTLTLWREGKKQDVKLKLGTRPDLEGTGIRPRMEQADEATGQRLGLALRRPPDGSPGALVAAVEPGSPAERAGLQPGMVVVEAGREPVADPQALVQQLREAKSGSAVLLRVEMGGQRALRALPVP